MNEWMKEWMNQWMNEWDIYDICYYNIWINEQIPNEKRVGETGVRYPIKTYKEKSAKEMVEMFQEMQKPPHTVDNQIKWNQIDDLLFFPLHCATLHCMLLLLYRFALHYYSCSIAFYIRECSPSFTLELHVLSRIISFHCFFQFIFPVKFLFYFRWRISRSRNSVT